MTEATFVLAELSVPAEGAEISPGNQKSRHGSERGTSGKEERTSLTLWTQQNLISQPELIAGSQHSCSWGAPSPKSPKTGAFCHFQLQVPLPLLALLGVFPQLRFVVEQGTRRGQNV